MNEHDCPSETITTWGDLMALTSAYMETGIRYAYRGEADCAWHLQPSLHRLIRPGSLTTSQLLLRLEREMTEEFAAQAHLYLGVEHLPQVDELPLVSWWPLMQHYGAPTRLLDWTHSPFVAAYFAVEKHVDRDGVVYVIDAPAAQGRLQDRFGNLNAGLREVWPTMFQPDAPNEAFFWTHTARRSARDVAQQGLFSLSQNVAGSHARFFDLMSTYSRHHSVPPAARWVIPATSKDEILRRLRIANIAAHSLFPGLDGLGRSVAEVGRIGPPPTFADIARRETAT